MIQDPFLASFAKADEALILLDIVTWKIHRQPTVDFHWQKCKRKTEKLKSDIRGYPKSSFLFTIFCELKIGVKFQFCIY